MLGRAWLVHCVGPLNLKSRANNVDPPSHSEAPGAAELDRIFRLESERTVSDDWVVRCENHFFNCSGTVASSHQRRARCWAARAEYRGRAVSWQEIAPPAKPRVLPGSSRKAAGVGKSVPRKRKWIPPSYHPWREPFCRAEQQRQRRLAAAPARPTNTRTKNRSKIQKRGHF